MEWLDDGAVNTVPDSGGDSGMTPGSASGWLHDPRWPLYQSPGSTYESGTGVTVLRSQDTLGEPRNILILLESERKKSQI